jgi:hypothetical protein
MRSPSKRPPKANPTPKPNDPIPQTMQVGHPVHQDSAFERASRRLYVLTAANSGASLSRIIEEGAKRRPIPLDEEEIVAIYRTHLVQVKRAYAQAVDTFREMQVERLASDLVRLRMGEPMMTKDGTQMYLTRVLDDGRQEKHQLRRYDSAGIIRTERLLAEITGTMAPKQIDVDVRHDATDALAKVIASYDPRERERIEEEQRQLEADAHELRVLQGGKR